MILTRNTVCLALIVLVYNRVNAQNSTPDTQLRQQSVQIPETKTTNNLEIDGKIVEESLRDNNGVIYLETIKSRFDQQLGHHPDEQTHHISFCNNVKINIQSKLQIQQQTELKTQIKISIRYLRGLTKAYIVPKNFKGQTHTEKEQVSNSGQNQEADKHSNQFIDLTEDQEKEEQQNRYLLTQLKDGLNIIEKNKIMQIYGTNEQLVLFLVAESYSSVVFRIGQPIRNVHSLQPNQKYTIKVSAAHLYGQIYQILIKQPYTLKFERYNGYPLINLYQCYQPNQQCYGDLHNIPVSPEKQQTLSTQPMSSQTQSSVFRIDGMMSKSQQYSGKPCYVDDSYCQLNLMIVSREAIDVELQIQLTYKNQSTLLQENMPLTQNIPSKQNKTYRFTASNEERILININVIEGKINYVVEEVSRISESGDLETFRQQGEDRQGPNQIEILLSQSDKKKLVGNRIFIIGVQSATEIISTFTISFSLGESEIYMTDGQTLAFSLTKQKNITLFYQNEEKVERPLHFSVSVHPPVAITSLLVSIYYIEDVSTYEIKQHNSEISTSPSQHLHSQIQEQRVTSSLVFEMPGDKQKIKISVRLDSSYEGTQSNGMNVNATFTITDAQIVVLPLNHPLPLQIPKESGINLVINNNQEGYIKLIVKRCDDTDPNIAYSTNSYEFLKQIYEYESPLQGQSQRIIRNTIRVKEGNSLYIHIGGDSTSNSFIEITAMYQQISRNKLSRIDHVKTGNHGQLQYQLITNSKVQITFEGLECGQQCRDQTEYECVWSTKRSQLFRNLYCPNSYMISAAQNPQILSKSYELTVKPALSDNEISFKHILQDSIVYMSIRAIYKPTNQIFYYKVVEIVTITGQIGRMSTTFLISTIIGALMLLLCCIYIVDKATFQGYRRVRVKP